MYSNIPMTPAVVDIGAAFVAAVHAVLAEPVAATAIVAARSEAMKLSEEEAAKVAEARALLAQADELRAEMARREMAVTDSEVTNSEAKKKLNAAYEVHTANVEALLSSERILASDQKKHDEDVKEFEAQKNALASEWKKLLDGQEENRVWEADLARREQALAGFAANLAGKAATG